LRLVGILFPHIIISKYSLVRTNNAKTNRNSITSLSSATQEQVEIDRKRQAPLLLFHEPIQERKKIYPNERLKASQTSRFYDISVGPEHGVMVLEMLVWAEEKIR
jgi:hypothetical protein